jgi:L-fuconolactonase
MREIDRRTFLKSSAAAALGSLAGRDNSSALPQLDTIIETHGQFYDPSRPGGVPWPSKDETALYCTVLPADYKRVTAAFNIRGVSEVEAGPLVEDNQWVLDLGRREPIILGTRGDLQIGKADSVRVWNVFTRRAGSSGYVSGPPGAGFFALTSEIRNPDTISNLKLLVQAGLEADVLSGATILEVVVQISDNFPDLRLVIEHMPFNAPDSDLERSKTARALGEMKDRPQLFCKVSNILRRVDGRLQHQPSRPAQ